MKKLISSILLLGILSTGFAQINVSFRANRPSNQLVVDTRGMRDFIVVVDGREYKSDGSALVLNSLYNGNHRVAVYEQRRNMLFGRQRQQLVYNSAVRLKPGVETSLTIGRNGQAEVNERSLYRDDRRYERRYDRRYDNQNDNWNNK
jgi:hypothetical protein